MSTGGEMAVGFTFDAWHCTGERRIRAVRAVKRLFVCDYYSWLLQRKLNIPTRSQLASQLIAFVPLSLSESAWSSSTVGRVAVRN